MGFTETVQRTIVIWISIIATLVGFACASRPRYVWYSELPQRIESAPRTTIEPGDRILVQVAGHTELSGEFVVSMSGAYNHPVVGPVAVAGVEPARAATLIKQALSRIVEVESISVTLVAYRPMRITVMGEVSEQGAIEVPHGSGVMTALAMAGGLTPFASEDDIYVLRSDPQPARIRFRYSDLTRPEPAAVRFQLREGDVVLVE